MEEIKRKPFHESAIYGLKSEWEYWCLTTAFSLREKSYQAFLTICTLITMTVIPEVHLKKILDELEKMREEASHYSDQRFHDVLVKTLNSLNKR